MIQWPTVCENAKKFDEQLEKDYKLPMPKMNQISAGYFLSDGTGDYNLSSVRGEIIKVVMCTDGIVIIAILPKESLCSHSKIFLEN